MFRSTTSSRCRRVIPLSSVPIQRRHQIRTWAKSDAQAGLARVVSCELCTDTNAYVVEYEADGIDRSLAEVLVDSQLGVTDRLAHVATVIDWLPYWWRLMGVPMFPTPADIMVTRDSGVMLLGLPRWRLPDIQAVFDHPALVRYLASEVVCCPTGFVWDEGAWQGADLFAVGAILRQCLYEEQEGVPVQKRLERAAIGTATPTDQQSRLALWQVDLSAVNDLFSQVEALAALEPDVRRAVNPSAMVEFLRHCLQRLDPFAAIEQARAEGDVAAYKLAQNILLDAESYDLCLQAGELAETCREPLRAIDFYERAIRFDPDRGEAYRAQFTLIDSARLYYGVLDTLFTTNIDSASQLCHKMVRDFEALNEAEQLCHESQLAQFLVWYGDQLTTGYQQAITFIYPRLFDVEGNPLWWKLELQLAYAEALLGAGHVEQAKDQVAVVREYLRRAQESGDFGAKIIQRSGSWLVRLVEKCDGLAKARPGSSSSTENTT